MTGWKRALMAGVVAVGLASGTDVSAKPAAKARPMYGTWGFDLTAMDRAVKPGDDFNRYASGAWLARTSIPADKPIASLRYLMTDLTESRLHDLLAAAAATAPEAPTTLDGKAGAFYKAFMDEARIDALGALPIAPELAAIRDAKDRAELAGLMGQTNSDFYGAIFNLGSDVDLKDVTRYAVYVGQGGLGLPDRDYYLKPSFAPQKAAYQAYVAKLLTLSGWPDAEANAAAIVAFETKIADASWTRVMGL
jgi:putative endopeptidase